MRSTLPLRELRQLDAIGAEREKVRAQRDAAAERLHDVCCSSVLVEDVSPMICRMIAGAPDVGDSVVPPNAYRRAFCDRAAAPQRPSRPRYAPGTAGQLVSWRARRPCRAAARMLCDMREGGVVYH